MSQALLSKKKKGFQSPFHFEFKAFWTLTRMLLSNAFSFDWKHHRKKAVIQLVVALIGFAAVAALSYLASYLSIRFMIFSLLAYVPMSVPSILIGVLLLFSFLGTLSKLCDTLFFAPDNKILLTLPASGTTLFLARLFVYFLKLYSRSLLLEIPIAIGYFLVSGYPVYMILLAFPIFALIDLFLVLVASLFAVPLFYVKRFLMTHRWASVSFSVLWIGALLAFATWLIVLVPDRIDIFSNWAPYFAAIQNGLSFYTNKLSFFYKTSMLYLGNFTGFSFSFFSGNALPGLWTFLALLGLTPLALFLSVLLVGPFYLALTSETGELLVKGKKKEEGLSLPEHSPAYSQLRKEAILFFGDESLSSPYLASFLLLPFLFALINRFFGAMDLNYRGEGYVLVADLLMMLLIATSSNSIAARLYSAEGGAFQLARTYPIRADWTISSKLLLPAAIGTLSILATTISLAFIWPKSGTALALLGIAAIAVYQGHLLYSAGLDFVSPKAAYSESNFLGSGEGRATIVSFVLSALFALLLYYFLKDPILWFGNVPLTASFKILLLSFLYLGLMALLYERKVHYIYQRGGTL